MISGIGETIGAATIGEIGDIERFDTPGKLVAFAGLDASVHQSGEFSGTKGGDIQTGLTVSPQGDLDGCFQSRLLRSDSFQILPGPQRAGKTSSDSRQRRCKKNVQYHFHYPEREQALRGKSSKRLKTLSFVPYSLFKVLFFCSFFCY